MNLIKPEYLKQGDKIAIIAPSGCVEKDKILLAKQFIESKGYNVSLSKNIFKKDRYFAGSDSERIEDIENAFSDKSINAIFCARGGYGALRIINSINYDIIKNNPKIFCGYSDITVLSLMILKKTGLVTFSSPMLQGDFQPDTLDEFTQKHFWSTITGKTVNIHPTELKIYKNGEAEGILWGGNLATVASMCGSNFIPDYPLIFFTEDLNEPVYKIDRYFNQLLNTQTFRNNLKGIILGEFLDVNYPDQLDELFFEIAKELNIPIYSGYKISHGKTKITVPIGEVVVLKNDGEILFNCN